MAFPADLPLVSTVAAGLSLAFAFGMLATRLKIPPIVGYLFAGILIGPYTPGFTGDIVLAEQLAEIGIVLLMFGVGLHFSLKDMAEVRRIALPGAIGQITAAIAMGVAVGSWYWGWPIAKSLMFGLALSTASTVVLLRALEENKILSTINGRIAIGWLIVEDLAMVLALVCLPVLAQAQGAGGAAELFSTLGIAVLKIAAFVVIMLVGGRRFLPALLTMVVKTNSRELFTLAVMAVTVGLAFVAATTFGVSLALGAFFAGMMIRESELNHEVADRALPFQDAFAVLFFVAVGMLFNPAIVVEEPLMLLATIAMVWLGKSIAAFVIILIMRYPLKTGLLVSSALAQIGEFSFMLMTLGMVYGLISELAQNLILATAIITIALNPMTFYMSRSLYAWVGTKPKISRWFNMRDDALAQLDADETAGLHNMIILVGHGRLGRYIRRAIQEAQMDVVLVDDSREHVDELRDMGHRAIVGDATYPEVLEEAAIEKATAVIVAIKDPFEARRIGETAHSLNPNVKVVVHANNDVEREYFDEQDIDFVVMSPEETARRMISYIEKVLMVEKTKKTA